MNTKQLWTSLNLNEITNSYFDGIYSIDTLKYIEKKLQLIICNTDPSHKPGKHWVFFFFGENSADFFDSLGTDISFYGTEFISFIEKFSKNFKQCIGRLQPNNTSVCGFYCLFYAYHKCLGKNMESILYNMNDCKKVLNVVKDKFYISCTNECKLLQKCKLL